MNQLHLVLAAASLLPLSCAGPQAKRPLNNIDLPKPTVVGPLLVRVDAVAKFRGQPFALVSGTALNMVHERIDFASVSIPVLAANNVKIGDALVQVISLDPGQTCAFEGMVTLGITNEQAITEVGRPRLLAAR